MNLASRGQRDMDKGSEAIADSAELAQVRRQARKVHILGLVGGILLTGIALAIPNG